MTRARQLAHAPAQGSRVLIIDDMLGTGSTMYGACELVRIRASMCVCARVRSCWGGSCVSGCVGLRLRLCLCLYLCVSLSLVCLPACRWLSGCLICASCMTCMFANWFVFAPRWSADHLVPLPCFRCVFVCLCARVRVRGCISQSDCTTSG